MALSCCDSTTNRRHPLSAARISCRNNYGAFQSASVCRHLDAFFHFGDLFKLAQLSPWILVTGACRNTGQPFTGLFLDLLAFSFRCQQTWMAFMTYFYQQFFVRPQRFSKPDIAGPGTCRVVLLTTAHQHYHTSLPIDQPL